jgi:glycosyltransferase involved in cell wall biosynthesis
MDFRIDGVETGNVPSPLVSCIMPTRNRRAFVGQAVWYFLRQDYPRKELIVLDDGDDSVADLIPPDEEIRYVRLDRRLPVGEKRNLGCEMSRGELIAHWDDDDWIAPHRLATQVRELMESDSDVCGAGELLHYGLDTGEAWLYRREPDDPPWVAGGTLLYRRDAWERSPFPKIDVGEDVQFVALQPEDRVRAASDASFYVALIHRGNTSSKRLSDPHWERRPFDAVSSLLMLDRDFYAALRNGHPPHPARPRQSETVTVGAPLMIYDGYGSMAESVILGMSRAGATVHVVPLHLDERGLSDELTAILRRSKPDLNDPALYISWPNPDLARFRQSRDLFIYTMWESDTLPAGWAEALNTARAVLVPTRFVAETFRQNGVTAPIEVIAPGIDPETYRYIERPERPGLVTLVVGTVIGRKHVREAIAGWKAAFAGDAEARLIIKSRFRYGNYTPDDPRITFIDDSVATRGIAHWYAEADVLVAVGNEGFGLPLVEGMATGLPVIALSSEGQGDVCADAGPERVLAIAPAHFEPCEDDQFGRCGVRGVPGVDDIAARLRWVADHRAEARAMGREASLWARARRNIWTTGPRVIEAMERHAQPARPLRRLDTFWVPSWQKPCGIAEYTAYLVDTLTNVRVAADEPDPRGVRFLHVQHEHSLFDETQLTLSLQRARLDGTPIAVTEHTVRSDVQAWEREANVLVSLTASGAEVLRARWPGKRVAHLPHGCPTWFPARKKTRGRVIGAFGFLEPHKGFWKLLDVLRAMPDAELLLVSHSKHRANEEQWARDATGLRVRHHHRFLPVADAARLLAAEADILVYWYDDVTHHSASGAVRIGLATGVPVLASPTNWFTELRDVTYQPADLAGGVRRLFDDTDLRDALTSRARDYCHANSWPVTAERHQQLWRSLDALN